jgi:hypothetical protein
MRKGLCKRCYYTIRIRQQYGGRHLETIWLTRVVAKTPTEHPPGSEGRILEYQRRAMSGEHLFHPADYKYTDLR